MCILEELTFKIFRECMPSDLPSVLAPSAFDPILAGPTLNCFRRACLQAMTSGYLQAMTSGYLQAMTSGYLQAMTSGYL